MLRYAYIYVVTRDYGFAPNPFYGFCTLATCKPAIRKAAHVNDWIFGIGSKTNMKNKLIYMMRVSSKISFEDYWNTSRYEVKRANMNSSLKKMYGDNIYHFDTTNDVWIQEDSHHSYASGIPNPHNLKKDTKSNNVLISDKYYYFGKSALDIPEEFVSTIYKSTRGFKKDLFTANIQLFIDYISSNFEAGLIDDPVLFDKFKRYDGVS